jgi:2-isopropylmalate synthase
MPRSTYPNLEQINLNKVLIYDTTLRDGTQREGIALSVEDKLKITRLLDELGVDYIEGGFPGSNPKDIGYFERVRALPLRHAKVSAFGMTCRAGVAPADDDNVQALANAGTSVVTVVGKSWLLHVYEVLRIQPDENWRIIRETLAYLASLGREVIYDAEHFFDGYKADSEYALTTLRAALEGGATNVTLCDTNGGTMYWEIEAIVEQVRAAYPGVAFGIHTHNDGELGVANSLAAVRAGVNLVQGTMNGYGERCGNANLCSIIPDLGFKMGYDVLTPESMRQLTYVSRAVAEIANLPSDNHLAYVGRSAFAHKGGMHAAAIRRNVSSYQHIDPAAVGNEMRVLVSDLSGRGNVLTKAEEFDMDVSSEQAVRVLDEIKRLESEGYVFEGAEASVALMLQRAQPGYQPPFEVVDFMTVVEHSGRRGILAEATVKLRVRNQVIHTAAEGNGPVDALDNALRKALVAAYPAIESFKLNDYKVRILDGENATEARTRVLIDTQNHHRRWSTVGASTNIIEASWKALIDAFEYGLTLALPTAEAIANPQTLAASVGD